MLPIKPQWRFGPPHAALLLLVTGAVAPVDVSAQLGAIEVLARRVTDLSFNAHVGGLAPASDEVRSDAVGLRSFGLELLFEIGTVEEEIGPAPEPSDSVSLAWTQMIVEVGPDGTDTTYTYEVTRATPGAPPTRTLWTFEMGLGYGQLVGFEAGQPDFELFGQVRDLPAASIYASYEPMGFYFGMRSGFMHMQGLQGYNASGDAFAGKAESFLLAGMVGRSYEVLGINFFLEAAYSVRYFPSVEWRSQRAGVPLDPVLPRELSFSSWSLGTGIQFGVGG